MMKRGYISLILVSILLGISGCGVRNEEIAEEIELLEPMSAIYITEPVAYRSLYDADTYSSNVLPVIEEYAFEEGGEVERFAAFPGETVKAGDTLVYRNIEKLDEEIESLEEKLADMEKAQLEYWAEVTENLVEPTGEVERLADIVDSLEDSEPEQYIKAADGTVSTNPEYARWVADYDKYDGLYRVKSHNVFMQETALRQKTEIYELDHAYYQENLKELKAERASYILQADTAGEVLTIGQADYGTYEAKADKAVVAVGDMSKKILKCTFIQKSNITNAEEVYAVIGGEKYELEYHPLETKEYFKLKESGDTIYSTFSVLGDTEAVQIGEYAVITVVNEKRENVLTVPKDSIDREGATTYVYVIEDGQSVRRDVEIGMSDGVYTEILSGLQEGEQIMVQKPLRYGEEEAVLEKGSCSTVFMQTGFMYYPDIVDVINTITYGEAYFVEKNVELYQYVEKGDLIATVRVEADSIEMQRKQLKLQRLTERLQDILDEGDPEGNKKTIAAKQEEIVELQQEIAEMQQDAATTQIVAPKSGIIVKLGSYGADTFLKKDCLIAQIADASTCYVKVTNTNQLLQYGNEVTITYKNELRQECEVTGTVATVARAGVSKPLQSEDVWILIPEEVSAEMLSVNKEEDNRSRRTVYQVLDAAKEMNNVVLVPRKAVTELAGQTYVHVIDENGDIKAQSFIFGGYDTSNYWVIDGLTEGTKVCLE